MNSIYLKDNWKLQPSEELNSDVVDILKVSYETNSWLNAEVPSTIMKTLVDNGVHDKPYIDTNLKDNSKNSFSGILNFKIENIEINCQ